VFLALLEDPDEETRSEVVGFLGHTVGEAERAAQGLLGHVRDESSVAVQADVRMSLANLHVRSAELDRLTEPWITAPDEFRQIVAWSARLRARPEPDGSAHLASKLPDGVDGPRSWWGVGQPFSIMELLTARRGWSAEPVLRRAVVQTLLGMRGYVAYRVLRWVLAEFFDEGKASIPEHASDLKPAQFELLSSLSQLPDFFERPLNPGLLIENTQSEMRDFGLPCDHRRLTRWIAGETRTACLR
jgi:hypothetical protein